MMVKSNPEWCKFTAHVLWWQCQNEKSSETSRKNLQEIHLHSPQLWPTSMVWSSKNIQTQIG